LGAVDPATYNPANGIKYFPHEIKVTETSMGAMLPPMANPTLVVTDARSYLFDQLSFLWATAGYKNMMDPSINDAQHYAYHRVFDGSPFPAPMSQTGMPGPFDLMMGTSKVIFLNTMTMHYNATAGTFVDIAKLENGLVKQEKTISAENAGYILVVLAEFAKEFAGTPLQAMAENALTAQANFIIAKLKDTHGGFYNSYKIGSGADRENKTMATQAALIRGLYAAYSYTNNAAYLTTANSAYNFLVNNFYVPSEKMFKTELNNNLATYTPFNLALLSGALREARLTGNQADAVSIYTRISKTTYDNMLLSEAEQTGETGSNADGDAIPYIAGGNKPFVFAAEGTHLFKKKNHDEEDNDEHHHSFITKVYPNPAIAVIYLTLNLQKEGEISVTVYDLNGTIVLKKAKVSLNSGNQTISLNTNKLKVGSYFVRVTSDNEVIGIGRFIKATTEGGNGKY
jgi:hypothetical protein